MHFRESMIHSMVSTVDSNNTLVLIELFMHGLMVTLDTLRICTLQ